MFIVCLQLLRWKNAVLSSKTALFEDGWQKIPGSSSKTALYEDGVRYYKLMEHQKLNFLGKIRVVLQ